MILFLIILSVILAIIIILYFIIKLIINDKKDKSLKYFVINKLRKCSQPTIILLGANGRYGNIIKRKNDKILVFFVDDDEIYATFININNFQMINDKEDVSSILANDGKENLMAFAFNYRLFISSKYRISSLQIKRDYYLPSSNHSFLNNEIGSFIITSLSPLIIKKIDDINFKIIQDYMNVSWVDDNLLDATYIEIKSCPILINSFYWILGTYKNKLILLIFNFVDKSIVNKIVKEIDDDITVFNGMIYNKFKDEFIIPISKKGKVNIMTWKI